MNLKAQLTGLNKFLTEIYQTDTRLSKLLMHLGFEKKQIELLRDQQLEPVVTNFITVINEKLENRQFYIISRRFGLDGEVPDTLQTIGNNLGLSRERIRQLEQEAIKRCSYKGTLMTFSNRLHEIALKELGSSIERPNQDRVIDKLDMLAEIRTALEINRVDYETRRAEILKTVQAELDALEEEYAPLLQEPQEVISNLETEIKNDVLLNGATIKGSKYKAVYLRGRITWDTKGITKYAEVNPEILNFKKQGQPSVSIRAIRDSNSSKDNNSILKKPQYTESKKVYSADEVLQEFPRTYEQWSQDEDERLKQQFANDLSLSELAIFFERNPGAIRSRLIQLSLIY